MYPDEIFAVGKSFLHRMDPRAKLIVAVVFSIVVALLDNRTAQVMALVFSSALVALARLNIGRLLRRLLAANVFVAILWLTLPLAISGEAAFEALGLEFSRAGLERALAVTLRLNAILAALIALLNTSRVLELAHAARHFRVPDKLVVLFFFTFRYLFVITAEYRSLRDAMKMRAFRPRTNLHTYRTFGNLVGMLLVRSHDRAERVYQAMLCRGFKGRFHLLSHFALRPVDCVAAAAMLSFAALLVGIQCKLITL